MQWATEYKMIRLHKKNYIFFLTSSLCQLPGRQSVETLGLAMFHLRHLNLSLGCIIFPSSQPCIHPIHSFLPSSSVVSSTDMYSTLQRASLITVICWCVSTVPGGWWLEIFFSPTLCDLYSAFHFGINHINFQHTTLYLSSKLQYVLLTASFRYPQNWNSRGAKSDECRGLSEPLLRPLHRPGKAAWRQFMTSRL